MSIQAYRTLPYWVRRAIVILIQLIFVMAGVLLSASTATPGELRAYQPVFGVAASTPKTCPEVIADMATSILKVILPSAGISSTTTNTIEGGM